MAKKQYIVQVAGLIIALKILLVFALMLSVSTAAAAYEVEDGSPHTEKQMDGPVGDPDPCAEIVLARYEVPLSSDVPCEGENLFAKQAHPWIFEIAKQAHPWIFEIMKQAHLWIFKVW